MRKDFGSARAMQEGKCQKDEDRKMAKMTKEMGTSEWEGEKKFQAPNTKIQ